MIIKNILVVGFDKTSNGGIASVVKTLANAFELDDEIKYSFLKTTHYKDKSFIHQIIILIKSILKCLFLFFFKKIDIIHIHASYGFSFYRKFIFFILSKLFNKKIIFHIHSSKFYEFYLKPNIIIRCVMLNSDLVIVLNKDWLEKLKEFYPLANIQKVYNPIKIDNNQKFIPSNRTEYLQVLFMGFYIEEKGIIDLLEVSNLFINKPIKFLFCGKGKLDGIISNKAKSNPNIINMGWVDGIVKEKLFKESDVLILPSYNEGLPISILEAMKHSLPIISTNIAGIPEQVEHGVNGYLFSPGDINHLKEIINSFILLDNNDLDKLRANSFSFVKNFSQNTIKKTVKLIYSNV